MREVAANVVEERKKADARVEVMSSRLDEAHEAVEIAKRAEKEANDRLIGMTMTTKAMRVEERRLKESLASSERKVEELQVMVPGLKGKIQELEETVSSIAVFTKMRTKAALLRRLLRGEDLLGSAQKEVDLYINDVGEEGDLDSDDEKDALEAVEGGVGEAVKEGGEATVDAGPSCAHTVETQADTEAQELEVVAGRGDDKLLEATDDVAPV